MKKKHLLFILQGGKGGTLEYIKALLEHLNKDKYQFSVICHGEVYEELRRLGYNTHYVEMEREITIIKDSISLVKVMFYLIKNRPDIVYSHSSKGGVIGRLAAGILKIPNFYNPHGWSFIMDVGSGKKMFFIWVEKLISLFVDKIILVSGAEYNDAVAKHIAKKDKLILITNGVDLAKFDKSNGGELKRSLGIADHHKVVGMISRLVDLKSPQTFIKTAKIVLASYPECRFILIGDGELKDEAEKLVQDLSLEQKIIFTGWVDAPEKYISIIDVGVLTSKWEGFGLVLAEMMACGIPVVASEVHGIPFVVSKNMDGFLCKPDDVEAFVCYILRLLNDNELYKNMSESAYKNAREKFDLRRVIQQHEEVFDSLS